MNVGAGPRSPGNGARVNTGSVMLKWPANPVSGAYVLYVGTQRLLKTGSFPNETLTAGTQRFNIGPEAEYAPLFYSEGLRYWQVDTVIYVDMFGWSLLDSSPVWFFDVQQAAVPPGGASSSPGPSPDTLMYVSGAVAVLGIVWVLNSARHNTR